MMLLFKKSCLCLFALFCFTGSATREAFAQQRYVPSDQSDPTLEIIGGIIQALTPPPPPPRPPRPTWPSDYDDYDYFPPPRPVRPVRPAPPPTPPAPKPVDPIKNTVPPQVTKPEANAPFATVKKCGLQLLEDLRKQVSSVTRSAVDGIRDSLDRRLPPVADLVAQVANGKPLSEQQAILDRVRMGDLDSVILATSGDKSPEAEQLRQYARAVQALDEVATAANAGKLDNAKRRDLVKALAAGGFSVPTSGGTSPFFTMFDQANAVARVIANGQPNPPVGPLNTLLLVGGLPASQVILLGGGGALVGTGGDTQGVTLTTGSLGQAVGMNTEAGEPVPDDNNDPLGTGTIIKNTGTIKVNFVVGGKRAELEAGQAKVYSVKDGGTIEFYSGDEGSQKQRFKLEDACYEFRISEDSWKFVKVKYSVTIDNGDNSIDFLYVALNKRSTLPAGESKTIASSHPVVVRFDNGNNEIKQKRLVTGTFKVALNEKGHLDLYSVENVAPPLPVQEHMEAESVDIFGDWSGKDAPTFLSDGPSGVNEGISSDAPLIFQ